MTSAPHSWTPIPLTSVAAEPPSPPKYVGVLYEDRIHVWSGEPEALKSLATNFAAHDVIRAGGSVMNVDFENGERETLNSTLR